MKSKLRKLLSVPLSLSLLCGMIAASPMTTTATEPEAQGSQYETYALDKVQGGAILHCWNWSFDQIKAHLPEIAAAGYTAVQTSPIQPPVDYSSAWTDTRGQWWKLYQPLDFSIPTVEGHSWLGTKAQLTSLCTESDNYGIKVIVDVVANHLANNGDTDGDGKMSEAEEAALSIHAAPEWRNNYSTYFHQNTTHTNSKSRYNTTQYQMGMPDLNTENNYVQQRVLDFLKECVTCGVDGFRFDAAKHIELPGEADSTHGAFGSDFWPNVINGINASHSGLYIYGEILGYPGIDVTNYTQYMAVTDNETGNDALRNVKTNNAAGLASSSYNKGSEVEKYVLWAESHDTYNELAFKGYGTVPTDQQIVNTWAIVGARADSTALYFSRHNETMGLASSDDTWKSTAVAEVNKFKNAFDGQGEVLSSLGKTAYIERGTKGAVISKLDGAGEVRLNAKKLVDGSYTDTVTNTPFTVSGGVISGTVGESGVAVLYNDNGIVDETVAALPAKLYLNTGGSSLWNQAGARFAIYLKDKSGNNTTVQMSDADGDDIFDATVPAGNWTKVTFWRIKSSGAISIDNCWNKSGEEVIPLDGKDMFVVEDWSKYSWSAYTHTHQFTGQPAWTWSDDHSSAYAVFSGCTECSKSYAAAATVTSAAANGQITYTATVTYNGQTYTDTQQVEEEAITFYLDATDWNPENSRYAIYLYNDSGNTWADMTLIGNNIYSCTVSAGSWTNVIFCRMYSNQPTNNWDNKKNQTVDLSIPNDGNTMFTITGWGDSSNGDKSVGNWGAYTPDEPTEYTITWKNWDGSSLGTTTVTAGQTPSYTGAEPTKASDAENNYTFAGWTPQLTAATADAEYTATFTAIPVGSHTITWLNDDGTTLATSIVADGNTPVYSGSTPQKNCVYGKKNYDGAYIYSFDSWTPAITAATADATYTATYSATPVDYYLVGSFNSWTPSPDYVMVRNTEQSKVEFMILGQQLAAGDELKVNSPNNNRNKWYPGGSNNNIVISSTGRYNVYVRPNYDGGTLFSGTSTEESIYVQEVYAVNYDSAGGSDVDTEFVDVDRGTANEPTDPTRTGYSFGGWYNGDEPYDFNSDTVTGDITLTAHWTENKVTISFNNKSGVTKKTDNKNVMTEVNAGDFTVPAAPYLDGYTFGGWKVNGEDTVYTTEEALKARIQEVLDPDNPVAISVNEVYNRDETRYLVTVNNGRLRDKKIAPLNIGRALVSDVIYVVADDPEEGKKFDHWTKDGIVVGYDTTYSFRMPAAATVLEAHYTDVAETVVPVGTAYIESVKIPAANKIAFVAICCIPDGDSYSWVSGGLVAKKNISDGEEITTANCNFNKVSSVTTAATKKLKYTWTKGSVGSDIWYVRPYVTYTDSNNTEQTVYGDTYMAQIVNGELVYSQVVNS